MFKNKVGRPSNETIRKRKIIKFSIALFLVMVGVLLTYSLASIKPNKIKGEIEDKDKCIGKCAELGFKDENFYKSVIDSYNEYYGKFNNDILEYENNLTKEEFINKAKNLYNIQASNKDIVDTTGIEYFVNLITLSLSNNRISKIDLSQNKLLEQLGITSNLLIELDLHENKKIKKLFASYNKLTKVEVSNLTELEDCLLRNNKISSLDLTSNSKLRELDILNNKIYSINLKNNKNIKDFFCDYTIMGDIQSEFIKNLNKFVLGIILRQNDEFYLGDIFTYADIDVSKYKIESDTLVYDFDRKTIKGVKKGYLKAAFGETNVFEMIGFVGDDYSYNGIDQKINKYIIDDDNSSIDVKFESIEEIIDNIYSKDNYTIQIIGNKLYVVVNDYILEDSVEYDLIIKEYIVNNIYNGIGTNESKYEIDEKNSIINIKDDLIDKVLDNIYSKDGYDLYVRDDKLYIINKNNEIVHIYSIIKDNNDNTTTTVNQITQNRNNNPNTNDNIKVYLIILIIALVMGVGVLIYSIKNKKK